MNPFDEAIQIINELDGSSTAEGLAKLILTFYNDVHPFSITECMRGFDPAMRALALRMLNHYLAHGEDKSLLNAGERIKETWPTILELSKAGRQAKSDVLQKWRDTLLEDVPEEE